ncbi:MAG TPA: HAD family hydrolase [Rubrobacteraceae bacterium]|nr:HAD family hydrolase [Rubrobacteraceae bacterium]
MGLQSNGTKNRLSFDLGVFDLDGTVLRRDLVISEKTVAAFDRLRDSGMRLVVATGRRYEGAREHAGRLGFGGEDPVICYGGSMIRRMNGETLLHRTLPRDLGVEALEWAESRGLHTRIFMDDAIVASQDAPTAFERLSNPGEPRISPVDSPAAWLAENSSVEPTKLVIVDQPQGVERWLREAQDAFAGRLFVTRSLPHYVEISSPEGTKSNALAVMCEHWEVDPRRVLAFGDADNDIDMLRFVGHGVAVGGLSGEVREAADEVIEPVHEDGVANYIERLLGERPLGGVDA